MQTIDASIPLSVKPLQLDSPLKAYGQAMNIKQLQANTELKNLELAQGMQTLKDQQELAHLAGDPANIDPKTGGFKAEAMTRITNPLLRQKLNQSRMQMLKEQADIDWRTSETKLKADEAKTKALHGVMEEAYSTYEGTRARTGDDQAATDAFNRALTAGYEDLRTSGRGGFAKDTQFKMLTPDEVGAKLIGHKERVDEAAKKETAARADDTPIIKELRYVEKLKGQIADLAPGDPGAASLKQQLAKVESHIARLNKGPDAARERPLSDVAKLNDDLANERITQAQFDAAIGRKEPRDKLQADALSAYRARYPYGFIPAMYGKDQPSPEKYVEEYLKNKEAGAKTMPSGVKADPPKVSSKAEFEKLKPGDLFIDTRDGKIKEKGK